MNYIKSLHIEGFKKFNNLDVEFNKHMNILVGENEVGKSTILDAIKLVLNQQYKNSDKSILKDLFNATQVHKFECKPSVKTLPKILIEIEFELDTNNRNSIRFFGEMHRDKQSHSEKFGILFECKYDENIDPDVEESINQGKIPYEYYSLTWTTFAHQPYQTLKRPFNSISIDTSDTISSQSFNYYNKSLFTSKYDDSIRMHAKNEFRSGLEKIFTEIELPPIDENRKFGIDAKKVILESVVSVFEGSIPLENRGHGMENLIKTKIALERNSKVDVILIEEPENHLSISTLNKMLNEISRTKDSSQIILTTHNNLIASRLNLTNVLWIAGNQVISLRNINQDDADFFIKSDHNSFLHLLLSEKSFLVEGPTEFLLLPAFYKQVTSHTIEEDNISIISCNGISYKRYLRVLEGTNKKIAVLTDNDKDELRISQAKEFNLENNNQHVFMGKTVDDWTWEVCLIKRNKCVLDELIKPDENSKYLVYGADIGDKTLGKMLNQKVESAYKILKSNTKLIIPDHICEAIEWLKK